MTAHSISILSVFKSPSLTSTQTICVDTIFSGGALSVLAPPGYAYHAGAKARALSINCAINCWRSCTNVHSSTS